MKAISVEHYISEKNYKAAAKALYSYFPAVRKFVVQAGGNKQEAEDVFQDGLLVFFRKVESGDFLQKSSAQTYLYGICKHLWLDELRRKKQFQKFEQSVTIESATAEFSVEEHVALKRAEAAFALLGEKCKALLQLFYFKGKRLTEIAKQLGFSSDKVAKNQKYRCLEKAKEHLQTIQLNSHE